MPKTKRQSMDQLRALHATRKQGFVVSKREQNNLSEIAKETGLLIATDQDKKWAGYDVLSKFRSDCHNAPVNWSDDKQSYICVKCNKACDTR